jgi:SP family galactose:H+ symporter-like MFS transporter
MWALSAAMGGLITGFQIGVVSGVLLFVRRQFALGAFEQGALVSVLPLGAMAGGLLAGRLADGLGRRATLVLAGVAFAAGTLLAVFAPRFVVLLAGRAVIGVAAGAASSTVPVYLSEMAEPTTRGRLVGLNQLMLAVGILVAFLVDLVFAVSGAWRAMLAVSLLPTAAFALGMWRAPEPPPVARQEQENVAPAHKLLEPWARAALVIALVLAVAQQFSGVNAVISYAPSIMEKTGLNESNSILYSVAIAAVNVAATVVSFRLVDRAGRRPLLLGSSAGMAVALGGLGLAFLLPAGAAQTWLSLACLLIFITAFAVGMGLVFWILIAEIFPPAVRASGASIAAATNWLAYFVVGLGFLPLARAIGETATFWLFGGVCVFVLVFARRYVPETKGRTFEAVDAEVRARWSAGGRPALGAYR